jgi:transglutaminase-like putative cysteine protease
MYGLPKNANWIEKLPDGHQATLRTLEVMRFLVRKDYRRPSVRSIVTFLCTTQRALACVQALFLFARDGIRYVPDPPDLELVRDFDHTWAGREGDCDDKVSWLATALLAIDTPARFVVQTYAGHIFEDGWDHVYLEFYDWNRWKWVALDPTADEHTGIFAPIGWRQPLPKSGFEMRYSI